MNNIYIAPEAEVLCFRPVENLAIDFDSMQNVTDKPIDPVDKLSGDIMIEI